MSFSVEINQSSLRDARAALDFIKNGAERAIVRAINRCLEVAKTDFAKVASEELNLSQQKIKEKITTDKPNFRKLNGSVSRKGPPVPLIQFTATRQNKTGVSVKVKKSSSRTTLKHAFFGEVNKAEGREGHKGVWWRETGYVGKGRTRTANRNFARLPKAYRLPIKELFGPRVEDILGKADNLRGIVSRAGELFEKRLAHEVDYLLKQQLSAEE